MVASIGGVVEAFREGNFMHQRAFPAFLAIVGGGAIVLGNRIRKEQKNRACTQIKTSGER